MTVQELKKEVEGKTVAVVGIGVSNIPLIRFLVQCGARVIAYDRRRAEQLEGYEELQKLGISFVLGENYLDSIAIEAVKVFKTPGIRFDVPALQEAAKRGAEITSEMELFFQLCPAKILAVTGSDGKTTTTSLIYDMLTRAGYTCYLGGNIGHPLIEAVENIMSLIHI